MAAKLADLKRMFDQGVERGATHMIVKVDSFDQEDYPVYVMPGEDPRKVDTKNSDRTMECYSIALGWDAQTQGWVQNWD